MRHKIRGIVIREMDKGETSKLLTVLTSTLGVITVYAKGARKLLSPNLKIAQLFVLSEMLVYERNSYYVLIEGTVCAEFYPIRNDIKDYSLACYLCEAASAFAVQGDESEGVLRLLLNSLYAVENKLCSHRQIKAALELRLCAENGFLPDVWDCEYCGKPLGDNDFLFHLNDGVSCCTNCASPNGSIVHIPLAVGKAVRHIIESELSHFLSFRISDDDVEKLSAVIERYFLLRSERGFKTLSFFKQCEELQ